MSDRLYPTLPPVPETLTVRVDGTTCTGGWSWNALIAAVVLHAGGGCEPDAGQTVELDYDVRCGP